MEKRKIADINISVECVVFGYDNNRLKVLLIEQKPPPNGQLSIDSLQASIPGDLMLASESIDQCLHRILKEYLGAAPEFLKQFHVFANPSRMKGLIDKDWHRQFRSHHDKPVIALTWYALVQMNNFNPEIESVGAKAIWLDIAKVEDLVLDHNLILKKAISELREDLLHYDIGLEILPDKFTLSQLQNLYEIIADEQLDKRNFRKMIKKMDNLIALNEKQQGVLHKPAQLFRYNKVKKELM